VKRQIPPAVRSASRCEQRSAIEREWSAALLDHWE